MATIVVPRLDDATILKVFGAIRNHTAPESMGTNGLGFDHFNLLSPDETAKNILKTLEQPNSFLITNVSLSYRGLNFVYDRNQNPDRPNPFCDTVRIDHNGSAART